MIEYDEKRNKEENESIKQKLHKLYYPLRKILNQYEDINITNIRDPTYYSSIKNDMQEIIQYSYLSSDKMIEPLNRFISIFDKNAARILKELRDTLEKQKKNSSDDNARDIELKIFMLNDYWSDTRNQILTKPTETEAQTAYDLYHDIWEIIKDDISDYESRI